MGSKSEWCLAGVVGATVLLAAVAAGRGARAADEERLPLVFSGGHDTDPRDHGRPVVLVAAGLGVTPQVFRDAFSKVRPAPAGREPEPEQVRRNKEVLLEALEPHGVTNVELDRVSNYYRYRPGRGRLWPVTNAAGYAVVKDGAVASVVITSPGAGYTTPSAVTVAGHPEWAFEVKLAFGRDLKKNGAVTAVTPVKGKAAKSSGN